MHLLTWVVFGLIGYVVNTLYKALKDRSRIIMEAESLIHDTDIILNYILRVLINSNCIIINVVQCWVAAGRRPQPAVYHRDNGQEHARWAHASRIVLPNLSRIIHCV
jgi:hypothetical protein